MKFGIHWRLIAFLGLLLLSWATVSQCQAMSAGPDLQNEFSYERWKSEQGLPHNLVKSVVQTRDGYLWFGTHFGLVRFDGKKFRSFNRANSPELTTDHCEALAADLDGSLWIGERDRLIRYKDRHFTTIPLSEGPIPDRLWALIPAKDGGLWIASDAGVKRYHNGRMQLFPITQNGANLDVHTVGEDKNGTVWAGTYTGLFYRRRGSNSFQELPGPNGISLKSVACIEVDGDDGVWVGSRRFGLYHFNNGVWEHFTQREGMQSDSIRFITHDSRGNTWIGLKEGRLYRYLDGRMVEADGSQTLFRDDVACLFEDREANLWVGTFFSGLKRLQPRWISVYYTSGGIGENNIWSIAEGKNDRLWFATDLGIGLLENGRIQTYAAGPEQFLPSAAPPGFWPEENFETKCVMEDRKGNLWVGSKSGGLHLFKNGNWIRVPFTGKREEDQVRALYEDKSGRVWIGTKETLFHTEGPRVVPFRSPLGSSLRMVRCIHEDRYKNFWFGTYSNGLYRLANNQLTLFTTKDGLSDNSTWEIFEDKEGVIWIGTEHGLNRYKDGRFTPFTTKQGLFDNVVNSILEDDLGHLWISCNRGIYRVTKQELHAVADGKLAAVTYNSFGTSDGMLSSETGGENQPSACRTSDGSLWFPTASGLAKIDPRTIRPNLLEPPVVIEEVMVDGEILNPLNEIKLGPGRGNVVEIHYTGNSFVAPEKVEFEYFLEGLDKAPRRVGDNRVAHYTNLGPGKYRFQVKAANNNGIWNTNGVWLAFSIAPHFYQTNPFYAICAISVVVLGVLIHAARVRVLTRFQRLEQRNALDRERARIASEMHDDLGASLTQIALLGELVRRDINQPENARVHISKITNTARDLFRAMDEIVWAVNPKHDNLSSAIDYVGKYAQQYLRVANIRCRLDIPEDLPSTQINSDQRHHFFLAVKEALNNVVKHSKATEVWVRASLNSTSFELSIEDNGQGFTPANINLSRNGLSNLRNRLNHIGGEFRIESKSGHGTRILFSIPLRTTSHPTKIGGLSEAHSESRMD